MRSRARQRASDFASTDAAAYPPSACRSTPAAGYPLSRQTSNHGSTGSRNCGEGRAGDGLPQAWRRSAGSASTWVNGRRPPVSGSDSGERAARPAPDRSPARPRPVTSSPGARRSARRLTSPITALPDGRIIHQQQRLARDRQDHRSPHPGAGDSLRNPHRADLMDQVGGADHMPQPIGSEYVCLISARLDKTPMPHIPHRNPSPTDKGHQNAQKRNPAGSSSVNDPDNPSLPSVFSRSVQSPESQQNSQ